jgi:tryptophan synthase alpha chain
MSRYKEMFSRLEKRAEGGFIPFAMLGDPDEETSLLVLKSFVEGGADALELGIPFSDPVADGPTIQAAALRAMEAGMTPDKALGIISRFRESDQTTPIGLLVYANLVVQGKDFEFYTKARNAGVDSILVADVPSREAGPFIAAAEQADIEPVFIAAPNSSPEQIAKIASLSQGYTYVVSRAGVTGTETKAGLDHVELMKTLKEHQAAPPVLGFGISSPDHVRQALDSGALGAISGSAIVKIIEAEREPAALKKKLIDFVSAMKAATRA